MLQLLITKLLILLYPGKSADLGTIKHYVTFSYVIDETEYKIRYETDGAGKDRMYNTGEIVRINCDKNDPEKFIISKDILRESNSFSMMVLGIMFFVIAIIIFIRS